MESISKQDAKELKKEIVLIHKKLERRKFRIIHSNPYDTNSDERPSQTHYS